MRYCVLRQILFLLTGVAMAGMSMAEAADLDSSTAERFAKLALACVHREYPTKIAHTLNSAKDIQSPRDLTPAFYGCYDWHSSVHGHWMLARLARTFPDAPFAAQARQALAVSLTPENLLREAKYVQGEGRDSFERPYGLAWLLQLAAELHEWNDPQAKQWAAALVPLERASRQRIVTWLPKLTRPIRTGEHNNTAFGLGLMLDYARIVGDKEFDALLRKRTLEFYREDRACPISYEPSGEDFLSPCIAEADTMTRVLPKAEFAAWFSTFLPAEFAASLKPGVVTDPTDGKLAHLDGLNLSRAWMLKAIAASLPVNDELTNSLRALAHEHQEDGLRSVTGEHYEGGHWLGSFAVYLLTNRNVT
jgi:Protein of unknown function (DUF2891)